MGISNQVQQKAAFLSKFSDQFLDEKFGTHNRVNIALKLIAEQGEGGHADAREKAQLYRSDLLEWAKGMGSGTPPDITLGSEPSSDKEHR